MHFQHYFSFVDRIRDFVQQVNLRKDTPIWQDVLNYPLPVVRNRKATQRHDHVYAYYPILTDQGIAFPDLNCSIPVEDVFEAKALEFVQHNIRRTGLPSWVLDYSQTSSHYDKLREMAYPRPSK